MSRSQLKAKFLDFLDENRLIFVLLRGLFQRFERDISDASVVPIIIALASATVSGTSQTQGRLYVVSHRGLVVFYYICCSYYCDYYLESL